MCPSSDRFHPLVTNAALAGTLIFTMLSFLPGCSPERVPRVESRPEVPHHPRRSDYLGTWRSQGSGEIALHIESDERGRVLIRGPANDAWDSVINNVRFEGDDLVYDQFNYFKGDDDFSDLQHGTADHPHSGRLNRTRLSVVDGVPGLMNFTIEMNDGTPLGELLERVEAGGNAEGLQ